MLQSAWLLFVQETERLVKAALAEASRTQQQRSQAKVSKLYPITAGCLSVGPIEKYIMCFVTLACEKDWRSRARGAKAT